MRCWLNQKGFFTAQNVKVGLREIDTLASNPKTGEKLHVECKVATNPIGAVRLRGPMKYSKNPLAHRVEEFAREKFERVSGKAVELLGTRTYERILVLGRINSRYDDPESVTREFGKHDIRVVFFDAVVDELLNLLGERRTPDPAGLYVQLLARERKARELQGK